MSSSAAGLAAFDSHYRGIFGKARWRKLLMALLQPNAHVALPNPFLPVSIVAQQLRQVPDRVSSLAAAAALEQSTTTTDSTTDKPKEPTLQVVPLCGSEEKSFLAGCFILTPVDNNKDSKTSPTIVPQSWPPPIAVPAAEPGEKSLLPYYLLDAASLLPIIAMDVRPGMHVCDVCAAPGGKSLATAFLLFASGATATYQSLPSAVANPPESLSGSSAIAEFKAKAAAAAAARSKAGNNDDDDDDDGEGDASSDGGGAHGSDEDADTKKNMTFWTKKSDNKENVEAGSRKPAKMTTTTTTAAKKGTTDDNSDNSDNGSDNDNDDDDDDDTDTGSELGRRSVLVSNDLSEARRKRLRGVMRDYLPASIAASIRITGYDGSDIASHQRGSLYDRVLVDVPCSSDRHCLADASELASWSSIRCKSMAKRQLPILCSAFRLARPPVGTTTPGGRIIYSTCALSPIENDELVAKAIARTNARADAQAKQSSNATTAAGRRVRANKPRVRVVKPTAFPIGEPTELGWRVLPDNANGWGPFYLCIIERY